MNERKSSVLSLLSVVLCCAGCSREDEHQDTTFYDRKIAPIIVGSCATSPTKSGCHVAADNIGNALGNLNVESYEKLTLRQDLLANYGPYGVPALLLKVLPPYQLSLTSWTGAPPTIVTTDIAHVGGSLIDFASPSFTQLRSWIERGATENNAPLAKPKLAVGDCAAKLGEDPLFQPDVEPSAADYARFKSSVSGVLGTQCASSNCHGSAGNTLYLTCGATDEQVRWNYFAASDYVSVGGESSEILRRTLAPSAGGTYHEGGTIFNSTSDPDYQQLRQWVVDKGGPTNVPSDEGFPFFAERVQPMLVKRGCMMLGCHSAPMFHDYRLRGGSGGHFGLAVTRKNYRLTLEQLALESSTPNASRLIRKNLLPTAEGGGMLHRGGPLLAKKTSCSDAELAAAETGPLDQQDPYCVISAWFNRERTARAAELTPLSAIVFVRRDAVNGADTPQDYATYAPGAELVRVSASLDAAGVVVPGAETSLSALCGLEVATSDVRRPAVSWDGKRIAFSARKSANESLRVYVIDGTTCAVETNIDRAPISDAGGPVPLNGELAHNFDPTFAPDGRIVFASTRGNTKNTGVFIYEGPQRTPADPSKLNANLYVLENDGKIRQLTFLLNQELAPSFMRDGRLIFTTEKRAPGFYQLAGRRINLDGGDYHPLFGQRSTIGYHQFTDVVELADKNFAVILSERGAQHGAGTLAILNRSIGIDQPSDNPEDYVHDAAAKDYANPRFFQHSLSIVDGRATGRLAATQGAYRSPSPLPNAQLLASYASNVVNLAAFSGNFDIVQVDPLTRRVSPVISGAKDELWPVAVYSRTKFEIFKSRLDEPNGATEVFDDERRDRSQVTFLNARLLTSLMFQNTRSPRPLFDSQLTMSVYESLPPEQGVTAFPGSSPFVHEDQFGKVYIRRVLLGPLDIHSDDSAAILIPGGAPVVLATNVQLEQDDFPVRHFQREEMQFYPGEESRQAFRRDLFNGVCGGCHGAVSGREEEVSVKPDILTQASRVMARANPPRDLRQHQGDIVGPESP